MLRPARVGLPTSALLSTGTSAAVGTGLVALSIISLGLPATLLLVGGWLLAAACSRLVPGLDGPVSWAAGVVLEVSLVSALSGVLAIVSGREHGSGPNLLVLGLPVLLGAVGVALGAWRDRGRETAPLESRTRARPVIAATVVAAGLIVPMWIASHGVDFRVAWALSGDSRNHVLIVRQILGAGGLTTTELRGYPADIDAITALISGAGHRGGLLPGRLMMHDIHALVATYVVTGIALATLIVAALLELLPKAVARARRLPAAIVVIVLLASSLSVSALVLGTSLQDGYLSSYATVPLVLAAMVLALRFCSDPSPAAFLLLGPAAILAFFGWTLLAVMPMALVIAACGVLLFRARTGTKLLTPSWVVAGVVTVGAELMLIGILLTHVTLLHTQFVEAGTITPPQPDILWLLGFLAIGLLAAAPRGALRWQLIVPVTAAAAGGATVKFLIWLSPDGKSWTYYAWKTLYLTSSSLLWVAFVPAVMAVTRREPATGYGWRSGAGRTLVGAALSLSVLVLVPWSTTLTSPIDKAKTGWTQPSAGIITETARVADRGQPFVLWHWSDPGNERLGEFWAALTWSYDSHQVAKVLGPTLPNGFAYWAYFEGSTPKDLCAVARAVNGINVITHDAKVRAELDATCPNVGAHVFVEK
jgi:hypothetical protein